MPSNRALTEDKRLRRHARAPGRAAAARLRAALRRRDAGRGGPDAPGALQPATMSMSSSSPTATASGSASSATSTNSPSRPRISCATPTARQDESRTAMGVLGVPSDHVDVSRLPRPGPDADVDDELVVADARSARPTPCPTTAPTTTRRRPTRPTAARRCSPTSRRQMQADQPTDIYVTHPSDDHPDHAAASVFVQTALNDLKAKGVPWAQTCRLHFYLVHRGDWPVPQGLHEDAALPPPAQMAAPGHALGAAAAVPPRRCRAKYAAIKRYPSQTEVIEPLSVLLRPPQRTVRHAGRRHDGLARVAGRPHPSGRRPARLGRACAPSRWTRRATASCAPSSPAPTSRASVRLPRQRFLYVRVDARQHLSPRVPLRRHPAPRSGRRPRRRER